jgi:hypothetical protein
MIIMRRSVRYLNQIGSGFVASLLAVSLFIPWSCLANPQYEPRASRSEFSANVEGNTRMGLHQNLVLEGDIVVENGTYLVENISLNVTGEIIARNEATVMIRNATLFVTTQDQTYYRDAIVLMNRSKLIVENATIFLKSTNIIESSYITVADEATANITNSKLHGIAFIIGRQNSRTYVNRSILKGPSPIDLRIFSVVTNDNSTATIQDSELDAARAGDNSSVSVFNSVIETRGVSASGNGLIEIENSKIGTAQFLWDNSTLRILNSTADVISFSGSVLYVANSRIRWDVLAYRNSTTWLMSTSVRRVQAYAQSQIWLINSWTEEVNTFDEGKVFVGWQLPVFGVVAVPHNWLPILQGIAFLAALIAVIAMLVVLNRRWKRRQEQKSKQQSQVSSQL